MSEQRISDADIERRLAELSRFRDEGSTTRLEWNERLALLELQSYRARIAAHAKAHPERLDDEHIADLLASVSEGWRLMGHEAKAVLTEIQQRRAAALGPAQLEHIKRARAAIAGGEVATMLAPHGWPDARDEVLEIFDAILRAHGVAP